MIDADALSQRVSRWGMVSSTDRVLDRHHAALARADEVIACRRSSRACNHLVGAGERRLRDFAAQLGSRKRPIASALTWPRPLSNMRSAGSELTGGLFRKYAVFLVALVGGSLLINALIELYYSYGESRQALSAVQREKAVGAATVIEQFVREIEGQVGWATGFLPTGSGLEQRRLDFFRLLRQAPAITEVTYIDGDGREQIKTSRLAMDTLASGADLSNEPKFANAKANKRYFSPVYYRK